nr:hypothetical protein Itr_chr11CG21710 [Ipomoea trifida]
MGIAAKKLLMYSLQASRPLHIIASCSLSLGSSSLVDSPSFLSAVLVLVLTIVFPSKAVSFVSFCSVLSLPGLIAALVKALAQCVDDVVCVLLYLQYEEVVVPAYNVDQRVATGNVVLKTGFRDFVPNVVKGHGAFEEIEPFIFDSFGMKEPNEGLLLGY